MVNGIFLLMQATCLCLKMALVEKMRFSSATINYHLAILESSYVTPKIFGVELAMYANFWRISKGFCLTGWRRLAWRKSKTL